MLKKAIQIFLTLSGLFHIVFLQNLSGSFIPTVKLEDEELKRFETSTVLGCALLRSGLVPTGG